MFITAFPAGLNDPIHDPIRDPIHESQMLSQRIYLILKDNNLSKEVSYMFGPLSLFWKLGIFFLGKASLYPILGCHTGDALVLFPH